MDTVDIRIKHPEGDIIIRVKRNCNVYAIAMVLFLFRKFTCNGFPVESEDMLEKHLVSGKKVVFTLTHFPMTPAWPIWNGNYVYPEFNGHGTFLFVPYEVCTWMIDYHQQPPTRKLIDGLGAVVKEHYSREYRGKKVCLCTLKKLVKVELISFLVVAKRKDLCSDIAEEVCSFHPDWSMLKTSE